MRLIDIENMDMPGKATMMKILDKYEREHPLEEITLPCSDYEIILYPDMGSGSTVKIRRKEK